eukprot:8535099-Pyramimonas_sp.AAC.1
MSRHFEILTHVEQMVHRLNINPTASSLGHDHHHSKAHGQDISSPSFRDTYFTDLDGKDQTLLMQMCLKVRGIKLDISLGRRGGSSPVVVID